MFQPHSKSQEVVQRLAQGPTGFLEELGWSAQSALFMQ